MKAINITQAMTLIQAGEILAYPTEGVYGLGCDPFNQQAFEKLLDAKQRPVEKGVILIASTVQQVKDLANIFYQPWTQQVLNSWEFPLRPTTWILPATEAVPDWITGGRDTVAIRVTHHPQVKALCDALEMPLVSTSANLSGHPPIKSREVCHETFPDIPILEGSLSGLSEPSQIWDAQRMVRIR